MRNQYFSEQAPDYSDHLSAHALYADRAPELCMDPRDLCLQRKIVHLFVQKTEQTDAEGISILAPQMISILQWDLKQRWAYDENKDGQYRTAGGSCVVLSLHRQ